MHEQATNKIIVVLHRSCGEVTVTKPCNLCEEMLAFAIHQGSGGAVALEPASQRLELSAHRLLPLATSRCAVLLFVQELL